MSATDPEALAVEPDESTASDATALRDLLQSEGWALLKAYAEQEWGPSGYGRQIAHAIASVPLGPDRPYELARVAEQVDQTAKAVNALIKWPEDTLRRMAGPEPSKRPFERFRRTAR